MVKFGSGGFVLDSSQYLSLLHQPEKNGTHPQSGQKWLENNYHAFA